MNNSPWLNQLKRQRPVLKLDKDTETDIAIIGGGIAGITTAYFVLKNTRKKVLLLEAGKVAHGATGHNAGQIVGYFERAFSSIVQEYGLELALKGQDDILSAWDLLKEIFDEAKLTTPLSQFTGYAGCQNLEQLVMHLENKRLMEGRSLRFEAVWVAENAPFLRQIPANYQGMYAIVPQQKILEFLDTENKNFFAALSARKGCLNSALFTEELTGYMLKKYPNRFELVEHTPVKKISLHQNFGILKTADYSVKAKRVILCTNGFENISIENLVGRDVDGKFHESVTGVVGFMAGYLEPVTHDPIAISYFHGNIPDGSGDISEATPYCYLTRRPYEVEKNLIHNLICMGGSELKLPTKEVYDKDHSYPAEGYAELDDALHKYYKHTPDPVEYKFKWHGLMGYTANGLRCIGPEPNNPVLLYNLGCNGVGILPSIYGGKRISLFLKYKKLEKSIFDPQNS